MTDNRGNLLSLIDVLEEDIRTLRGHAELLAMTSRDQGLDDPIQRALSALANDMRDRADSLHEKFTEAFHAVHSVTIGGDADKREDAE